MSISIVPVDWPKYFQIRLEEDPDAATYHDLFHSLYFGNAEERKIAMEFIKEWSTSCGRLAEMALVAIAYAGPAEGKTLLHAISKRTPDLFREMQKAVGQA